MLNTRAPAIAEQARGHEHAEAAAAAGPRNPAGRNLHAPNLGVARRVRSDGSLSGLELYLATAVECGWSPASDANWLGDPLVN